MSSKKGRKGKKLTKEEAASRKLLLEQEATKKRQELLDQFMKRKMGHEESRSRLNRIKIDRRWRELLREEKAQELKVEIDITSRAFERAMDLKDRLIAALAEDVVQAETLRGQSSESHVSKLDNLLRIQRSHLRQMRSNFDDELSAMSGRFESERKKMKEKRDSDMEDLGRLDAEMDTFFQDSRDAVIGEYQTFKDQQRDKGAEETQVLYAHVDASLEELRKQYRHTVAGYREETSEHGSCYRHLKAKDEANALEIAANARKIRSMTATLAQLEGRSDPNSKADGDTRDGAERERDGLKAQFLSLQANLEKMQTDWEGRLVEMTTISNGVIRDLQRILLKGEQVVKLANLCKKHERPEERAATLLPPLFRSRMSARSAPVSPPDPTDLFWGRSARAVLDKKSLLRQQRMLNLENEHLRSLLKNSLQGLCHADRQEAESERVKDEGGERAVYCVIEASHVVNHMLL